MSDGISTAMIEVVKYAVPVAMTWLAKVRRDMNAMFPKLRRLEERLESLEGAVEHLEDALAAKRSGTDG